MSASEAGRLLSPAHRDPRPAMAAGRLLRIELRHNAMMWVLPLAMGLFWFITYRKVAAMPPLWNVRSADTQGGVVADFITPVVGAAAWMGSREARRRAVDLLGTVARPRFARLLVAWAATTCWAIAGCLVCVASVYWVTARDASLGGPLWWPVAVAVASMPAFAALGFAAGVLVPSRLTAPVASVAAFFVLALSTELIVGSRSYWQVSPIVTGPWDIGPDPGVATFYPYLPDLSIAQLMFLAGLTVAVVAGALGLRRGSGASWLRAAAASAAAVGVAVAGTAVALAGTSRLDAHGMLAIPALHDSADDRPLRFTPVCSRTPIPVCLNPAYTAYLPAVTAALKPVLSEVAGLPGAPVRITQAPGTYLQGPGNQVAVRLAGPAVSGRPPVYRVLLPDQTLGPLISIDQVGSAVRSGIGPEIIADLVDDGPGASAAQHAVAAGLTMAAGLPLADLEQPGPADVTPGRSCKAPSARCAAAVQKLPRGVPGPPREAVQESSSLTAARRFEALPAQDRRVWLKQHLAALRAGRVTLKELP
jgi:hypothetical protein